MTEMLTAIRTTVTGSNSEWFWIMAQTFVVALTLFAIFKQVAAQNRSTLLAALFRLEDEWNSEAMKQNRRSAGHAYLHSEGTESMSAREHEVARFFEDLGLVQEVTNVQDKIVWSLFSLEIEKYWPLLEPKIKALQASSGDKTLFDKFQKLHEKMVRRSKRLGAPPFCPTSANLREFAHDEKVLPDSTAAQTPKTENGQSEQVRHTVLSIPFPFLRSSSYRYRLDLTRVPR